MAETAVEPTNQLDLENIILIFSSPSFDKEKKKEFKIQSEDHRGATPAPTSINVFYDAFLLCV